MKETHVGTRELKNNLSQYLRRVKAGETVIITEHGRPLGQIIPIQADLSDRIKKLAEAGVVDWNGESLASYQPKVVNKSDHLLSDLLLEDRE